MKQEKCSVIRVYLNSGGYTSSGHYYGIGAPLYHAYCEERNLDCHLRGRTREAVLETLRRDNLGITFFRE